MEVVCKGLGLVIASCKGKANKTQSFNWQLSRIMWQSRRKRQDRKIEGISQTQLRENQFGCRLPKKYTKKIPALSAPAKAKPSSFSLPLKLRPLTPKKGNENVLVIITEWYKERERGRRRLEQWVVGWKSGCVCFSKAKFKDKQTQVKQSWGFRFCSAVWCCVVACCYCYFPRCCWEPMPQQMFGSKNCASKLLRSFWPSFAYGNGACNFHYTLA